MTSYFKKNKKGLVILLLFIFVVSISQSIILKPHLGFGFSPDDVWSFNDFSSFGPNPFLKFPQLYKTFGPNFLNPIFYNGILFTFFKFDYPAYQITALIFKILSIISFYLLIQTVFKNRLLSFFAGFIYSFHYGSVGSMEMIARTQDYLVITGMNIFLILFHHIFAGKLKNISWLIICSLVLFVAFFINPIRAYPILPFILFLAILHFIKNRSLVNFYQITKRLILLFLPFILIFSVLRSDLPIYRNTLSLLQKIYAGNLQMLLSPFSSFGSLFLFGENLRFLSLSAWTMDRLAEYLLQGPLLIFGIITIILSKIVSSKPLKFFILVMLTNFILELLVFLVINLGSNLPDAVRMNYDAYTFTPPAILGLYILTVTFYIFLEWLKNRNIYLKLYLLGISFAITFIWFTWVVKDIYNIPLGIYGYTTIPSMGVSAALGSIFLLAYTKLKTHSEFTKRIAPIIFLILFPYFLFSNSQTQTYLNKLVYDGNSAKDQIYLKDKFWASIDKNNPCNKFIYLSMNDYPNGYYYAFIMIDRFDKWYNLYSPYQSKKPCPVRLTINDEEKLILSYSNKSTKEGFNYKSPDNKTLFFPLKDFYAFKLQNRDIYDITEEIIKKVRH